MFFHSVWLGGAATLGAAVIHQDDLLQEVRRRPVEHAVHGAKQRGPDLVHEAEDHAGGRQVVVDQAPCAAGGGREKKTQNTSAPRRDEAREERTGEGEAHVSGLVSGRARSTGIWSLR